MSRRLVGRVLAPSSALAGSGAASSAAGCCTTTKGASASHLHRGHRGLRALSHWSMHSTWKRCLQGSTRSLFPSLQGRP